MTDEYYCQPPLCEATNLAEPLNQLVTASVSYQTVSVYRFALIMMFNSGNSQLQWRMVNERLTSRGEGLARLPLHRYMF